MNIVLWVIQGLLALIFLMAGFMKTFMPLTTLQKNMAWVADVPAPFVRFIGVAELLGAIGLILPAAIGIASWLTIVAAIGLMVAMISAAIFHISRREYPNTVPSVVLLLLAVFVVLSRLTFAHL
ncbi:MAG TPA: DoxX family protein [Ktedonosporobacter sp.]|nr:DoxX family protein [Ktedonosporobacter sp.]